MTAACLRAYHDAELALGTRSLAALLWIDPALPAGGGDVALRVWTPRGVSVALLRHVAADAADLRDAAVALDARTAQYPTGRWSDARPREYELAVTLPPRQAGDEMLAARVHVVVDGVVAAQTSIAVSWTTAEQTTQRTATGAAVRATAAAAAELTTGRAPARRPAAAMPSSAHERCDRCGERAAHGDRFCECCGASLLAI